MTKIQEGISDGQDKIPPQKTKEKSPHTNLDERVRKVVYNLEDWLTNLPDVRCIGKKQCESNKVSNDAHLFLPQLKESASKSTDLQHQLEKAKQQHQELQALQQNTNGKLREAQVRLLCNLSPQTFIISSVSTKHKKTAVFKIY